LREVWPDRAADGHDAAIVKAFAGGVVELIDEIEGRRAPQWQPALVGFCYPCGFALDAALSKGSVLAIKMPAIKVGMRTAAMNRHKILELGES
jgi:hypothetical protein